MAPENKIDWKEPPEGMTAFYESLLLRLPPAERLLMCCRMFQTARTLALAGIINRLGENADPREIKKALLALDYKNPDDMAVLQAISPLYTGFAESTFEDYEEIRRLMNKLGML